MKNSHRVNSNLFEVMVCKFPNQEQFLAWHRVPGALQADKWALMYQHCCRFPSPTLPHDSCHQKEEGRQHEKSQGLKKSLGSSFNEQ